MNHLATSKEDILAASRELIKENGWAAVSIRALAARCSVSSGTIYNYYESKADLLGDTIESIWQEIFFHPEDEQIFQDAAPLRLDQSGSIGLGITFIIVSLICQYGAEKSYE